MKKLKNQIQGLDKKQLYQIQILFTIIMIAINYFTKKKFDNGYQFFISFISIVPVDVYIVLIMLRSIFELEGPPRNPFYLIKYPGYFMIAIFTSAPFLYLWGMRDVIAHLKW